MKLICEGIDLSNAITKVSKAISTKALSETLECIKVTAKGDYLTLLATDTEIAIEKTIRAEILEEGEVLVQGRLFGEMVKKLESEQIEMMIDGLTMKLRYSDCESCLQLSDAEDFPLINKNLGENSFTMSQKDFRDMIAMSSFAAAQDESRPILKGCKMEVEDGNVSCVAIDGFRMAIVKKPISASTGNFSAIIPCRTLVEISRLLEKDDDTVTVLIQKNMLMVEVDGTVLISRLMTGDYIDYKGIIPHEFLTMARVSREALLKSVDRASIVARGMKNLIKFDIKDNAIAVSANSEYGKIEEKVVINLEGKDLMIAFNSRFVTEMLKAITDDFIYMYFTSSIAPCVVRPYRGDDYLYLLLPIRINS